MSDTGFHFFLKAKINDKKCWLLLDTGASNSVFDVSVATKFNFKVKSPGEMNAVGVGTSSLSHNLSRLKKIKIGKLVVKKLDTVLIDLSVPNQHYKQLKLPRIDGIIGADILVKYQAEINFKKNILLLNK
ncbi:MAG: retropepsin-like aspartic protease [Bacteroidota bacterium]